MSNETTAILQAENKCYLNINVTEGGQIEFERLNGATWDNAAECLINALNNLCEHPVRVKDI